MIIYGRKGRLSSRIQKAATPFSGQGCYILSEGGYCVGGAMCQESLVMRIVEDQETGTVFHTVKTKQIRLAVIILNLNNVQNQAIAFRHHLP